MSGGERRITEPSTRRLVGPRNPRSVSAPESEEMKKQSVRANSIVACDRNFNKNACGLKVGKHFI